MRGRAVIILGMISLTVSCQVEPYAPPPQKTIVESVEVQIKDFHGRPDAFAVVKGRLSTSAALLVDAKQYREGNNIYIEVLEQTPRGANLLPDLAETPPYQTRIPIDLLGLAPGKYQVNANDVLTIFEVPGLQAQTISETTGHEPRKPAVRILDEFIPIEKYEAPAMKTFKSEPMPRPTSPPPFPTDAPTGS